jgi:hypothetical protein
MKAFMKKRRAKGVRFAICITDSEPDLEPRNVYQVLPDEAASEVDDVRVIDESGEDYLDPAREFILLDLPESVERVLSGVF